MGIRPIEDNESIYQQKPIYLLSLIFSLYFFFCRALAALGFGRSLPLCAEKRSSLLYESEEIFVALLEKQSVHRHESTTVIVVSRGNFAWQQFAAAAASLLIRASSTILCASEVVGMFAKFLASSLRLAVVEPAECDSSCRLLIRELNGVE